MRDSVLRGNVPLFRVGEPNYNLSGELLSSFERVLRSGMYILGDEGHRFEKEFAAFCGVPHCVALNSGTDALVLGLRSLGMPDDAEVIVPSLTFPATVMAVVEAGYKPVF